MIKNVISVIDGEAGSCGKAKVVGEIATDRTINLGAAVTNCMPNAGHTFVDEKGKNYHYQRRNAQCEQCHSINYHFTDLYFGYVEDSGECLRFGLEYQQCKTLKQVADSDCRYQNRKGRRLAQRTVCEKFNGHSEKNTYKNTYRNTYDRRKLCH